VIGASLDNVESHSARLGSTGVLNIAWVFSGFSCCVRSQSDCNRVFCGGMLCAVVCFLMCACVACVFFV
jgi:hypothetical protein